MSCIERFLEHFHGNQTEAGRRISVSRQQVSVWKKNGLIPMRHASTVELVTDYKVSRLEILDEHERASKLKVRKNGRRRQL